MDASRSLSRHIAYRDGALALGPSPAAATLLPPDYVREAQDVAGGQLALAGYRIAAVLQGLR